MTLSQSTMIYSRDFIFAMCYIFLCNPYIRNYWQGLYFHVSMLSRIYMKVKSLRIKCVLQYYAHCIQIGLTMLAHNIIHVPAEARIWDLLVPKQTLYHWATFIDPLGFTESPPWEKWRQPLTYSIDYVLLITVAINIQYSMCLPIDERKKCLTWISFFSYSEASWL